MNRCFLLLCTILFLLICRQTAAESKPGLQDHHDKPDKEFREREERKNNQDEFREEFDN